MKKHSVSIRGHRTSFSLEEPFWQGLQNIARSRSVPVARVIMQIDADRGEGENLSSAIRVFVFNQLTHSEQKPQ
jgi:predicted DNA-binding ribbon-helix-helix protein